MKRRKILVIAPESDKIDLPKATIEIASIVRFHDATVLRGTVRDQDIAQAIVDDEFEVMWFITHGAVEGVLLSDGMLSSAALMQYVRADETRLCVLNTCASEEMAMQVAAGSGADVICTIGDVDNRDALRLGQLLAGELAYCESYRDAYDVVATPGSNYRYYDAGGVYRSFRREHDDELLRLYYRLEADVRVLRWLNLALVAVVLLEAYLLWQLYAGRGVL